MLWGAMMRSVEIVAGALLAARQIRVLVLFLVGNAEVIKTEIENLTDSTPDCIEIVNASEVVGMGEAQQQLYVVKIHP